MAEVLVHFETPVAHGGDIYEARAVGRPAGHMWEGWLEFLPRDGGAPVIGRVESTQPEREHLVYWATGLTPVFLEGALRRALAPAVVRVRTTERPASEAPAARVVHRTVPVPPVEAVLDPFEVGSRNLDILRQELTALDRPRLVNIVIAFELRAPGEDLTVMTAAQLRASIVAAVEARLARRSVTPLR